MRREVLLAFSELAFRDDPEPPGRACWNRTSPSRSAALPPARANWSRRCCRRWRKCWRPSACRSFLRWTTWSGCWRRGARSTCPPPRASSTAWPTLIDQTRGLLVILLLSSAACGTNSARPSTPFADHRLRQGVRVRDYGCVWDLELKLADGRADRTGRPAADGPAAGPGSAGRSAAAVLPFRTAGGAIDRDGRSGRAAHGAAAAARPLRRN